jgi:acetylornithine deacetylase/succinyl-diaminopimelate desuccinylase-like protein
MSQTAERLDAYLQANLDRYINETVELCAQPSVSARREGVLECAELVADILARHGLEVQRFETPGSPVLVGRGKGRSERTLLFYNHYDVQPPEPLELWTTPPFQPTLREGALYARGAVDDKGHLIARLAALDAVREAHGGELPCGVTFVVEGEEEIGSPHIAAFVREHLDLLRADAAVWEEGGTDLNGRPETLLGVRGILFVDVSVQTLKMDAHSGAASVLPNAAWRLLRLLASLKDANERILIPGFYEHALPPTPLDLELLEALPDLEAWGREVFGVREFVGGRTGKDLNAAGFNPTCNIAGITAGYQGEGTKTVIPARASAKVDFRLVPNQDPEDILARLRRHLDEGGFSDAELTQHATMWPYKASADDPFIRLAGQTAEEVYQKPYKILPLSGGSSPIYAFAGPLGGIPVITAGVGNYANRTHSPDEHVRLVDFLNGSRHIARILDGFAGLPSGRKG